MGARADRDKQKKRKVVPSGPAQAKTELDTVFGSAHRLVFTALIALLVLTMIYLATRPRLDTHQLIAMTIILLTITVLTLYRMVRGHLEFPGGKLKIEARQ
jgi:hypothetical protein